VSALVLDAGAFVAVDRGDRATIVQLRAAQRSGLELRSTGPVVAQVWRDPAGKHANLARLLRSVDIVSIGKDLGQQCGVLLGRAGGSDVVDAGVVTVAQTGDRIVTSDPGDIRPLVAASGRSILVIPC